MIRNVIFSFLFGLLFYGLLVLVAVPETFGSVAETLWAAPALIAVLFVLRYATLLSERASAAGARLWVGETLVHDDPTTHGATPYRRKSASARAARAAGRAGRGFCRKRFWRTGQRPRGRGAGRWPRAR